MSFLLLLGVSDHNLASSLRAQLGELPEMQVSSVETSTAEIPAALGDIQDIDVLLVHEGLGPLPVHTLIRDMCRRYPHLAVVLIVEEATPESFTAAMESGARALLSSRPSLDELQARITAAAQWSREMRRHFDRDFTGPIMPGQSGSLIALAGAKGGTGTTTLAVHLALVASAARRSVCLVDMDLQTGDIPSFLDLTHRRSVVDLVDVADDINPTVLADTLFVHPAGPHILLAPSEGEKGEDVTARVARGVLGGLRSRYEIVIVDCGSHTTEASAMAVEMADRVVITTTPDLPALRAAKRLVRLLARLQVRKEEDLAILLTRASRNTEIQPEFARKILGLPMLNVAVPASFRALEQAINTGSPTTVEDDNFRRAIGQLALETGVVKGEEPPEEKKEPAAAGRRGRRRTGGDEGQGAVEFVGLVPFIFFVIFLLWQIVLFGFSAITAHHAANESARAMAVGKPMEEVRKAAEERMLPAWQERSEVLYREQTDEIVVRTKTPIVVPGKWYGPWAIEADAEVVHE